MLGEAAVAREQHADVDRAALDRLGGERSAGVEREELLEPQPVDVVEARQAEVAIGAFGRAAERHLAVRPAQVADRAQRELGRGGGDGHDEPVPALSGRGVEHVDALGLQQQREASRARSTGSDVGVPAEELDARSPRTRARPR